MVFGGKRGGTQMLLVTCPYCNASVRSDRLKRHVSRVHPGSRPVPVSSCKAVLQAKGEPLARRLTSRVKSGPRTARCSFCGLAQKTRKRLKCVRCGRTDNNPVIVKDAGQQRNATRPSPSEAQQPLDSRPSSAWAGPAAKSVPVPRARAKRGKSQVWQSCGLSARGSFVELDWWRERGE